MAIQAYGYSAGTVGITTTGMVMRGTRCNGTSTAVTLTPTPCHWQKARAVYNVFGNLVD